MKRGNRSSVYIAENYNLIRKSLIHVAEKSSEFEVSGYFENTKELLDAFRLQKPDIAIIDIELAKINGLNIISHIRKNSPHTRVVITTSHVDDKDLFFVFSSGANAYCLNSIETSSLFFILNELCRDVQWVYLSGCNLTPDSFLDMDNFRECNLTLPEDKVLKCILDGKTIAEIAGLTAMTMYSVRLHIKNIFSKLVRCDIVSKNLRKSTINASS